jgi:hypothetical protein
MRTVGKTIFFYIYIYLKLSIAISIAHTREKETPHVCVLHTVISHNNAPFIHESPYT